MTDDELRRYLKPKHNWLAIIGSLAAVAATVWGGSEWLHGRASSDDTKALQTDVFKVRLDMETMKGDQRAMNVQMTEGFKAMSVKLDSFNNGKRR